jgi:hypothetical protein
MAGLLVELVEADLLALAVCGKRATLSGNADRAKQKAAVRAEPNKRLEC